jgi:hypothetical protein
MTHFNGLFCSLHRQADFSPPERSRQQAQNIALNTLLTFALFASSHLCAQISVQPHDSGGAVLHEHDLKELEKIALEHGLLVLSDEVYERLIYDGLTHQSILRYPGLAEQSLALRKQLLGEDHPDYAGSLVTLVGLVALVLTTRTAGLRLRGRLLRGTSVAFPSARGGRHEQHHLLDRVGRGGRSDSRVLRLALRVRSARSLANALARPGGQGSRRIKARAASGGRPRCARTCGESW